MRENSKKIMWFVVLCTILLVNFSFIEGSSSNQINSSKIKTTNNNHIKIDGNQELTNTAHSGSGTEFNPLILENLNFKFVQENPITIENTDLHLIIRNIDFNGFSRTVDSSGIKLVNVKNLLILDSTIDQFEKGIDI